MRILQYFFQQLFVQIGCGRNIARTQAIVLFASAVFYAKLIAIVDRDAIGILYTDCVEISCRPGYVKLRRISGHTRFGTSSTIFRMKTKKSAQRDANTARWL